MSSDEAHFRDWANGDRTSGNQLVIKYIEGVRRFFATKVSGPVDDLVQASFLGCLAAKERFRGESKFSTFLYAVARNQLLKHYRNQNKHYPPGAISGAAVVDLGPSPSSIIGRDSQQQHLLLALNELPIDSQIVLELYYWESMSGREVSEVLEISERAVRSRLRRAKEELRSRLQLDPMFRDDAESSVSLEEWAESIRDIFRSL